MLSYEFAFFLAATLQQCQILTVVSKNLPVMIRYDIAFSFQVFFFFLSSQAPVLYCF